jgi:uncharacterized membrane protein YtjA (UPF0391 family)
MASVERRLNAVVAFRSSAALGLDAWNKPASRTVVGRRMRRRTMTLLRWALLFFIISIVAGLLGFTGISAASADVARILFYIFVVIFLVLLVLGLTIFRV